MDQEEVTARQQAADPALASIKRAVSVFRSNNEFRRALSHVSGKVISNSYLHTWLVRGSRVPAELCPDIELITGVTCEELRPDVHWHLIRGVIALRPRVDDQVDNTCDSNKPPADPVA